MNEVALPNPLLVSFYNPWKGFLMFSDGTDGIEKDQWHEVGV